MNQSRSKRVDHRRLRWPSLVAGCALVLGGATAASADDVSNNLDASVDATAESMALNTGGPNGTTVLSVVPASGDGKN